MKRAGFTMIELIFVIVILGILASVAMIKLAATRDDAKVATDSSDIAIAVLDMGSYYTAHGSFGTVGEMTNVKLSTSNTNFSDASAVDMNGSNTVYFGDTAGLGCLSFTTTAIDGNLTIASESNASSECAGLNKAVKRLMMTHHFGGDSVEY